MNITPNDLAYGLAALRTKQKPCRLYADYYAGVHNLVYASDAFRNAFGYLFKEFAYNRCAAVVDAVADRLTIEGWETDGKIAPAPGEDDRATESPVEKAAGDLWRANRMDKRQGEVHTEALRSGSSYLIVWPDAESGEVRFTPNAGHLMSVVYDDEYGERIAYAVKSWREARGPNAGKWRVTVYEPDVISRFITASKRTELPEKMTGLVPYEDDGGSDIENPYGRVPVFAFANNANTGCDGVSELSDIVPLQDALNKSVMDGLVAAEFLSYPQRVVTGIEPTIDPETGKAEPPFNVAMDRLVVLADAAAKFGEFSAADMAQFTNLQNEFDIKIARVSRVPVHWLNQTGNNFSSGEALKTAEAPLASKITDRQVAFGDVWAAAMQFALEVAAVSGDASGIQPIWAPAQSRSELDELNVALMKRGLGIPDTQIWAELGYSPDEIKRFTAAAEAKRQQEMEQFAQSFDRGDAPVGGKE